MSVASPSGTVVFIGAGPGAADLLTLRAVDRLRRADVIVHDRLVHPQLLATLPLATERICIDRGDLNDPDPGGTTGELLLRLAAEGRFVVRLKGGDPTVFARLTEELAPLRQAGVAVEIVPGVTAAVAAAAAAGMPLTSREAASSVTLITGRSARGKAEPIDLRPWAMLPGTLALYMGVEQIGEWSRQLMAAGRPRNTPVTLVSRCSWPDQQVATTTLDACAAEAGRQGWRVRTRPAPHHDRQVAPQGRRRARGGTGGFRRAGKRTGGFLRVRDTGSQRRPGGGRTGRQSRRFQLHRRHGER